MKAALTVFAALLAAAVQLPSAHGQEQPKTFADWSAGCEPSGRCAATTAIGSDTDGFVARYLLRVTRGAGLKDAWSISISTIATLADRDRPVEIRVDDNAPITLKPKSGYAPFGNVNDFFVTSDRALKTLFQQMLAGNTMRFTFLDVTAAPYDADFSLSGLSAALSWIDGRQGRRDDQRTASAPTGIAPAPEVDKSLAVARLGIPPRLLHLHRSASACEDPHSEVMSEFKPVIGPVSGTAMLYGIPCMAGAYNVGYRLYIVESGEIGGIEPLYFAAHTGSHGWSGSDVLFNISFDAATKTLSSFYKGRGLGDCGNAGTWIWRKYAFAMVRFRAWSRCDGKRSPGNWPVIFEAEAAN